MLTDGPAAVGVEPPRSRPAAPASRTRRLARDYGPALLLVVAAAGLWELLVRVLDVPDYLWPAPSVVARALWDDRGLLASATWVTVREIVLGFAIALAAGLVLGIAVHLVHTLRRALYPLLIASQSVPTVVLAPVLVIVLGFGLGPKLAIVALFCFFPIVVATVDGLAGVDPDYIRMMLTLDGSRSDIFRRIEFPAALPSIFSGTRIAATYAAIGAVFGEWAGSSAGLGFELQQASGQLETPRVFAVVVILTVLALALFALVSLAERLLAPWARGGTALR